MKGSRSVVEVKSPNHHFYRRQSHEPFETLPHPLHFVKTLPSFAAEDLRRCHRRSVPMLRKPPASPSPGSSPASLMSNSAAP